MIYLDCAATSLQKPAAVRRASAQAISRLASPGRGGHAPAMKAADRVFACREEIAGLFNLQEPERVVFTMNATHGLNIAANDLVSAGDRVVVSGYEHNAVTRALRLRGAEIDVAASPLFEPEAALKAFRRRIPGARAVFCTHVSNVFGFILPVYEISRLCQEAGLPFVLDASQSAGSLPIDFKALGAEYIAMPGHKGLLGPQGTGVLLCASPGTPLMAGGTGSNSRSQTMPEALPDRHEAGTLNVCGIAGLLEGVKYVRERGVAAIGEHESELCRLMVESLSRIPDLEVFASDNPEYQSGLVSIRHKSIGCEELAAALGREGVAVRAGLHCAPLAHKSAGTLDSGSLRLSFSPFNTASETARAAEIIKMTLKNLSENAK